MGVKVPASTANKFGCIVIDPVTFQVSRSCSVSIESPSLILSPPALGSALRRETRRVHFGHYQRRYLPV